MTLKRLAIVVHRWLGVTLCVAFLIWFPSGIGMMYWDFPNVGPRDRILRAGALEPGAIQLSPADAYAVLQTDEPPSQTQLHTFDGRPVYRFRSGRGERLVYADTGDEQIEVSEALMQRTAASWSGQPASAARVELMETVDQWTVQGQFDNYSPLWKYAWPDGQHVYVSELSGEVVQYTTTASRLGAYAGAIPHWFYFTPLRKHGPEWSRLVIWSSAIGTGAAILGIVIGIWMYSPSKRYRYAGTTTSIPYRGYKRWHTVLGLIFGLATATWAFSGMLSMDPFPRPTGGATGARPASGAAAVSRAFRSRLPLEAYATKHPREAIDQLRDTPVQALELSGFDGEAIYVATLGNGETRIVPMAGAPASGIPPPRIMDVVAKAAGPAGVAEMRVLDRYDRYYIDRRGQRPLPVVLARLNDAEQTRLYIDVHTGRVASTYSSSQWVTRWLYHGLHSLDFPWLYHYRPAWDIVVIAFMLGGTALALTSFILAWRVLGRTLRRGLMSSSAGQSVTVTEDLT